MIDSKQLAKNCREALFLLGCLLLVYALVALLSYHPKDPSFSSTRTATPLAVHNIGGTVGAYLSAMLLEWFGRSAYLLVVIMALCLYSVLLLPLDFTNKMGWVWAVTGVVLFMLTSSSLEYLRFHHNGGLPAGAGGVIGHLFAQSLAAHFGVFGASLLATGIWLLSWSLAANLSWFSFFGQVGRAAEWLARKLFRTRLQSNDEATTATLPAAPPQKKKWSIFGDGKASEAEDDAGTDAPVGVDTGGPPTPKKGWFGFSKRKREDPDDDVTAGAEDADDAADRPPPEPLATPTPRRRKTDRTLTAPAADADGSATASAATATEPAASGELPTTDLLDQPNRDDALSEAVLEQLAALIEEGLKSFNIVVKVVGNHPGPVVTRFDLQPATGVKGVQIVNLSKDLARSLSVPSIRVMETIPGTNYIGLEIPNAKRSVVSLSEIIASPVFQSTPCKLPLALGKSAAGQPTVADLAAMPHLLVAGATGSGKSVFINSVLLSLLFSRSPDDIRLLLIDPKMLELATYADIPHLLAPVVTDMELAPVALNWAVNEMERRYRMMADAGVRHITTYNEMVAAGTLLDERGTPAPRLQYIVVVIDELADLMMVSGKKVELFINRLAQKARAAGIHLILATQRPSVDVITGLIKANVPCRISFQVASKVDSRTILDQMGAESLLGKGDMLYLASGAGVPQRLHGAYISDKEVERVTESVRSNYAEVQYLTDFTDPVATTAGGADAGALGGLGDGDLEDGEQDALYDEAVELVVKSKRVSISLIQRRLRIGYNRAARLVEAMERAQVVSPPNDLGMRKLLTPPQD